MKIKRYSDNAGRTGRNAPDFLVDPEGVWVLFADVEQYLLVDPKDILTCNCAENFYGTPGPETPPGISPNAPYWPKHWICSAHGYKKR